MVTMGKVVPRHHHLGPLTISAYRSTLGQVILVGFLCFLVVGMHAVLVYLGGGGQLDATPSDNCNTILYAVRCLPPPPLAYKYAYTKQVYAFTCCLSGSLVNYFGIKSGLVIRSLGYCMYGASFWCYNHTQVRLGAPPPPPPVYGERWGLQSPILPKSPRGVFRGNFPAR